MSNPTLRQLQEATDALGAAMKQTWTPIPKLDLATCTLADWKAHQFWLRQLEHRGIARGERAGRLWLAAVVAPFRHLLNARFSNPEPVVSADLGWRWSRSPVLWAGSGSRLRLPGNDGAPDELLMKPVLMGNLAGRDLDALLEHAARLGKRLPALGRSRWPLPDAARETVLSITSPIDRWLGFCVLTSLSRQASGDQPARARVVIDGHRSPLLATLDDLLLGCPLAAVREVREREVRELGHPVSPPCTKSTPWMMLAECEQGIEDTFPATVAELVRGPRPHGLPDDAIERAEAERRFQCSNTHLRDLQREGRLTAFRRSNAPNAKVYYAIHELERILGKPRD